MDLSAYSIEELEDMAAAALSGDKVRIEEIDKAHRDRLAPEFARINARFGDRPICWDRNGRA